MVDFMYYNADRNGKWVGAEVITKIIANEKNPNIKHLIIDAFTLANVDWTTSGVMLWVACGSSDVKVLPLKGDNPSSVIVDYLKQEQHAQVNCYLMRMSDDFIHVATYKVSDPKGMDSWWGEFDTPLQERAIALLDDPGATLDMAMRKYIIKRLKGDM